MALHIERIENFPISSNCFIISDIEVSDRCIIVDPGTSDCKRLIQYLERESLVPEMVILTHEHFDHIAGVTTLRSHYKLSVVANEICSNFIQDEKRNLSLFRNGVGFAIEPAEKIVFNGFSEFWNGHLFLFYDAPGHTDGSIIFLIDNRFLFSGDSLILGEKVVTKLPTGSKKKMIKTLDLIKSFLEFSPVVFPGHGVSFSLVDFDFNNVL